MDALYVLQMNNLDEIIVKELSQLSRMFMRFENLPLYLITLDHRQINTIRSKPYVVDIRSIHEDHIKILYGFDNLLKYSKLSWDQKQRNGWIDFYGPGLLSDENEILFPPYPGIDFKVQPPQITADINTDLPTRLGLMPVIGFSLAPSKDESYDDLDPVVVAIKNALSYLNVTVAAGNEGPKKGTMNPWSMVPGVISVGATDSENGGNLENYSSRGNSSNGQGGPTIVTFGKSALPPYPSGTSFAAARVSGLINIFVAFLLTLNYFIQKCKGREQEGIPLVGFGIIDFDISLEKRGLKISALPTEGINIELLAEVISLLHDLGYEVHGSIPTPQILRRILISSAQKMIGYEVHEVGNGFVNKDTTYKFLASFCGFDMVKYFCRKTIRKEDLSNEIFKKPLILNGVLEVLMEIWTRSQRKWPYDLKKSHVSNPRPIS